MLDDPISRIEAALEAGPTPGPWRYEACGSRILDSGVGSSQLLIATVAVNTYRDQGRHNAEFIAACDPAAIRALLDRLKAAEQRSECWKAEYLAANAEIERMRTGGHEVPRQHERRLVIALDRAGKHFVRHMTAPTAEDLGSKSDIAAELAWRDAEIERLRAALAGVIAVADRKTDEFDRARAALENTDAR